MIESNGCTRDGAQDSTLEKWQICFDAWLESSRVSGVNKAKLHVTFLCLSLFPTTPALAVFILGMSGRESSVCGKMQHHGHDAGPPQREQGI
jgi:hypothetical protein